MDTPTTDSPAALHHTRCAPLDVFGVEVRVLCGGDSTNGLNSVAYITCPPGAGAPVHRHSQSEHFHMIEGSLSFLLEDRWERLHAGDSAHARPGVVHGFRNEGAAPAVFLSIASPSGHELFFRDANELAIAGAFNPETAAALCQRHGIELLSL